MPNYLAYSSTYRDCRIFGHMWTPTTCVKVPKVKGIKQSMRCKRCGAEKQFVLDGRGNQVRSSYKYDPAYLLPGKKPHDVRADMRREFYGL